MTRDDMSATVIVRGRLSCGHYCRALYEMGEHTLTLKTGPLKFPDPAHGFPDIATLLDKTLELSGKYDDVQFRGMIAQDGRFVCAECGTPLFALKREEEDADGQS